MSENENVRKNLAFERLNKFSCMKHLTLKKIGLLSKKWNSFKLNEQVRNSEILNKNKALCFIFIKNLI